MSAERSDLSLRAAGWTLAAVLGLVALACGLVAGFLAVSGGLREAAPRPPAARAAPMLQVAEHADRAAIEKHTKAPPSIEDAMRRTAAAGWDAAP